jgi:hypothetical protein
VVVFCPWRCKNIKSGLFQTKKIGRLLPNGVAEKEKGRETHPADTQN